MGITSFAAAQIGKSYTLNSEYLSEERGYRVYLPMNHGANPKETYPVLYVIDGDYNWAHVTGVVENLSDISKRIPPMIVVGISDRGHERYVENCTPKDSILNPTGNAANHLKFITEELRPKIESDYRCSAFQILMGHSLGGLFVMNTLITKPESFYGYLAISPSMWWNDYGYERAVKSFITRNRLINRKLFLSLGDETGMGVMGIVDELDKDVFASAYLQKEPLGLDYEYRHYKSESHNSVGLISLIEGLKWFFEGYEISVEEWMKIDSFEKYVNHITPFKTMLGDGFVIPEAQLNVFVKKAIGDEAVLKEMETFLMDSFETSLPVFYKLKGDNYVEKGKWNEAIMSYRKASEITPNSPELQMAQAKLFEAKGDTPKAKVYYQKALELAQANESRQWYINQIKASLDGLSN